MREKLTSLRIENGFSQQELAERLNVTRQAISMWESGATIPSIDSLILLSKLYGVSVDEFLGLASGKKDEEAKAEAPANAGKSPPPAAHRSGAAPGSARHRSERVSDVEG